MYKAYLSVIALLLIALTSSCSAGGDAAAQSQSGESQSALGTTESCQTLAADKVLTGGGSFTTDRAYNHSTCASGFLLDLNNLGAVYRGGTLAAYADRAPTDQATCEKLQMRVYAWKRESNGTLTFLGGAFPNGRWLSDAFGKQYCQTPSVMLEQRFPGYVAGGNYRLAMRAHSLDAQGAVVRQRIFFRTLKKGTPVLPGHVADDAVLSLNRLPTSGIPLNLNSVWARKSGWTGSSPLCRDLGLKLAFEKVTVPAYVKLGATEQVVRDRLTKEESIYNLLCNTPLATSAQQTQFYSDVRASLALSKQIFDEIASDNGITRDKAALMLAELLVASLDKVRSTCGTQFNEVAQFLNSGALPSGMAGPNVLFRNCTQTTSAMASLLSTTFGLGGTPTNVRSCIEEAMTTGSGICNDPRAQSTDSGQSATSPEDDHADVCDGDPDCEAQLVQNADVDFDLLSQIDKVKHDQARALGDYRAAKIESATADREARALISIAHELVALGDSIEAAGGEEGPEIRQAGVELLMETLTTSELLDAEYERRANQAVENLRDATDTLHFLCGTPQTPTTANLAKCPTTALCPGFDFAGGSRGWYSRAPDFADRTRPQNVYDRVNHCLCKAIGNRLPTCDDPEERQKQDCLTNPFGPDDGPRPECVRFLQPEQVDRDAIEARICTLIRPDCSNRDVMVTLDGKCGCAVGTGVAGSPLSPRCPAVIDCADDAVLNEQTCRCQPMNAGGTPFVQPAGCRVNVAGTPGAIDRWTLSRPNAVNLNRIPVTINGQTLTRDTLMFDRGFVAAALPVFRTQDYAQMGSKLFADVMIPTQTPPSGWRGVAQAHITIGTVHNAFVSQTELSTLSPGVRRVEFPLSSTVQSLLTQAGKDVRVTYILNTDVNAPALTSIANFGFSGTPLGTPSPSPTCPIITTTLPFPITLPPREVTLSPWPFLE
jgi:hypothetical protein